MDALRSVLMLLGVVLHAARPYDTGAWEVKDAARSPLLDGLTSTIHLFRMPAFFVVAGFFAMYLLLHRPTGAFLVERLRRVLVPLVATLLTFNLLQVWVVYGSGGAAGFLAGSLLPAWQTGAWVAHLWFLAVLAVYFAAMTLAAPLLRRLADPGVVAWLERRHTLDLLIGACALAPLGLAVASRLLKPGLSELVLGTVTIGELLSFLPPFVVGMLLYVAPRLLERFASCGWGVAALAVCGLVGLALTTGRADDASRALRLVARALLAWMMVRLLFELFRGWVDRPSPVFAYLSYASYSIYLFHHMVVIAAATVLLPSGYPPGVKFLLVLAIASLLPLALHHYEVLRRPVLGFLFNGRRPFVAVPAPGPLPAASVSGAR